MAANIAPYGNNVFGIETPGLDYAVADAPSSKTYHGASIVVANNIIGRITSWQPAALTRAVNHVYELSNVTWGRPVDIVPAQNTGYSIAVTRVEVWDEELEITLGYESKWSDLADQNRPFTIQEYLFRGTSVYQLWTYKGCWFSDKNEDAWTADGDGIIRVTATLMYLTREQSQ